MRFDRYLIVCGICLISMKTSHAELRIEPKITTVTVGGSVKITCFRTDYARYSVDWNHKPVDSDRKHIYSERAGGFTREYDKDFSVVNDNEARKYELTIKDVQPSYAGTYSCVDNDKFSTTMSAELIVIESTPHCKSSMSPDGFLGENSCNLEPDNFQLSCSFKFSGNVPPIVEWSSSDDSYKRDVTYDATSSAYNAMFRAESWMDGKHFTCRVKDVHQMETSRYECSTNAVKIINAVGSAESHKVDSNSRVHCGGPVTRLQLCNYTWAIKIGSDRFVSNRDTINLDESFPRGTYVCMARCRFHGRECDFQVYERTHDNTNNTKNVVIIVISIVACILLLALIAMILFYKKVIPVPTKCRKKYSYIRESAVSQASTNSNVLQGNMSDKDDIRRESKKNKKPKPLPKSKKEAETANLHNDPTDSKHQVKKPPPLPPPKENNNNIYTIPKLVLNQPTGTHGADAEHKIEVRKQPPPLSPKPAQEFSNPENSTDADGMFAAQTDREVKVNKAPPPQPPPKPQREPETNATNTEIPVEIADSIDLQHEDKPTSPVPLLR